ncbi:MAG: hypothetical protein ACM3U2_10865 [Deltaproteobacteria bacterium]
MGFPCLAEDDFEVAGDNAGPAGKAEGTESDPDPFDRDRHPLLERASQLWMRLHDMFKDGIPGKKAAPGKSSAESLLHALFHGAGDLYGGLAQALSGPDDYPDGGLCVTQLKRSRRGLAFTRGALFNFGSSGAISKPVRESLHATLDELETEIFQELGRARSGKSVIMPSSCHAWHNLCSCGVVIP